MTEYFYTQSLATAAAAIEQGFEGCEGYNARLLDKEPTWNSLFMGGLRMNMPYRFPKTPHNVALMAKQEFDVVKHIGKTIAFNRGGIIQYNINHKLYVCHSGFDDLQIDNWIIIERGNKPFPVWDKEGV